MWRRGPVIQSRSSTSCPQVLGLHLALVSPTSALERGCSRVSFWTTATAFGEFEPNSEMRKAGETELQAYAGFHSVDAPAEATTLRQDSVEFVTAGQAFHWFEPAQCRAEFSRILKTGGYVVLVWNARRMQSPVNRAYEEFLERHSLDHGTPSRHGAADDHIAQLYGERGWKRLEFDNPHRLDYPKLTSRMLSASYMPLPGAPNFEEVLAELRSFFDQYAVDGQVVFDQDAEVYYGRL